MRDPWEEAGFSQMFATLQRTSLPRAPLNSALSGIIAGDRSLSSLLGHAGPAQRQPVLLLAALHLLVLREPTAPLAAWYPTVTDAPRRPDDPALPATVHDFVGERAADVISIVADRHVQTNEIGRCALLVPPLAAIGAEVGQPLARLDVGASAGLTLLLPRFGYDYDVDGSTVRIGSGDIRLTCGVRGVLPVPLPPKLPNIATSVGLDPRPIDPTDDEEARWLLACCWPDELDRFERLRAALDLARTAPPRVVAGDALDAGAVIAEITGRPDVADGAHPVVTTTWVLNYLTSADRRAFVEQLGRLGAARDLDWVFAESPAQTPELPHPPTLAGEHRTALVRVAWRSGERHVTHVAQCHPHGHWMHALT